MHVLTLSLSYCDVICLFFKHKTFIRTTKSQEAQLSMKINVQKISLDELTHGYRKTSNIRGTSVGNKIVGHSDVVGASPVGAAPTTSSFPT